MSSRTDLDTALEHVASVAGKHADDVDRRARFPQEAIGALRETGLLGLNVAREHGGMGQGAAVTIAAVRTLAEQCASSGMIFTMHLSAVAAMQGADGFEDVLGEAAAGGHLSTLALSESATRSHFWISMGQTTDRDDGGAEIDVEKSFVTSAGPASSYVVSSGTQGRSDVNASDLFLVRATDSGVEVLDWWRGSGLRGNASAPMRFRCTLSPEARIGRAGSGQERIMRDIFPRFQLGTAGVSAGLSRSALSAIRDHLASARLQHLDERLIDQPVVRYNLGRLATEVAGAEGYVDSVAQAMDRGEAQLTDVLQLKALVNETALTATDRAMRLGGGFAYSGRSRLDRLFRDARAGVVMAPTPDVIYDMVGRDLAGLPVL